MTDFRALCARMADELDHYRQLLMDDRRETHALATEARAALAQPELTVQDCADMDKHRMSFIDEGSSGLITLDGCFTREELLELAQTRPGTEQESRPLPDAMQRRRLDIIWKQPKSAKTGDFWLDSSGVVRVYLDGEWVAVQEVE
jgi:hypothetical protein